MGNNNTKETRGPDQPSIHTSNDLSGASIPPGPSADRNYSQTHSPRLGREHRSDLYFLGIGSNSNAPVPGRRETKQERDARKLEKERQARIRERERSLNEEHVDGGFLVTMGIYTSVEDFNKAVVRQLMIERRIAPFWRGLSEHSESWSEHQLIASARGLPIPPKDGLLDKEALEVAPNGSLDRSDQDLSSIDLASTNSASAMSCGSSRPFFSTIPPSDMAPISSSHRVPTRSSTFRSRSKTIASLTNASQGLDYSDVVPKEISLPHDPYINGQPIEVFLYKQVIDCPICFLAYPPYLNKTRCCDQPVCSECFVQIKRPDPHPPEQSYSSANQETEDSVFEAESLVSRPACCPYCQQPDFGVIYEPPDFRRGLIYVNDTNENPRSPHKTLQSPLDKSKKNLSLPLSTASYQRRLTSISANAPTVISTDRIRPDWAIKLANARSYLARRSAAATALHTAAYLMGNGNTDTRSFGIRSSRFTRSIGADDGASSGSAQLGHDNVGNTSSQTPQNSKESQRNDVISRRNRIQEIEELMVMEAIRLSLAAEEERKKKVEKESAKEVKRKLKEMKDEKKREKREKKTVCGGVGNSASASSLSLSLPGLGRGRGNSVTGAQLRDINCNDSEISNSKGKEIDRRPVSFHASSTPIDFSRSDTSETYNNWNLQESRVIDNLHLTAVGESCEVSTCKSDEGSRDHQISNASSSTSSFGESVPDSPRHSFHRFGSSSSFDSPSTINGPTSSVGTPKSGESNGGPQPESLLNFQSLTAMILDDDDDINHNKGVSIFHVEDVHDKEKKIENTTEESNVTETITKEIALSEPDDFVAIQDGTPFVTAIVYGVNPEVIVTPGSPDVADRIENYST